MFYVLIAVTIGFVVDLLLGDPTWMYHPVQMIGKMIEFFTTIIRRCFPETRKWERFGGGLMVCLVLCLTTGVPFLLLHVAYSYAVWLGVILESFFCYQIMATTSLRKESMSVYKRLKEKDLAGARKAVGRIVGRDTDNLSEEEVAKAAVETIAENTSDGVIAPLFYMMIGGAVLGFVYKAVNTIDSMVGYQNDEYRNYGTCGAKLDDVVNWFPARVSAFLMLLVGKMIRGSKKAFFIWKRDRRKHKSPNSAQTEAVMAGILGVQLAGDAQYFGKLVEKPVIGDQDRSVEEEDIVRANRIMSLTAVTGLILFGVIRLGIMGILWQFLKIPLW